jgi:hypothetical protein
MVLALCVGLLALPGDAEAVVAGDDPTRATTVCVDGGTIDPPPGGGVGYSTALVPGGTTVTFKASGRTGSTNWVGSQRMQVAFRIEVLHPEDNSVLDEHLGSASVGTVQSEPFTHDWSFTWTWTNSGA